MSSDPATQSTLLPVLEARGIAKAFGPVEVLTNISLTIQPGEVHAIIGENGAGKSTLMKLLSGHLQPTRGSVAMDGEDVTLAGPVDAEHRGLVLVHQEILLAPHLTVAQNIFMGRELKRGHMVNDREMNRLAAGNACDMGGFRRNGAPIRRVRAQAAPSAISARTPITLPVLFPA